MEAHAMAAHKPWRTVLATVLALGALAVAAAAAVTYFGWFNVAATREHPDPVYHFLHIAMRRSIDARADGITVPRLDVGSRIDHGFVLFREHCAQCHGAPGVAPQPFAFGLRPEPPALYVPARDWPPAHLYWIIKYGVKMTGMPAWQYRLGEQDLWDLTAFLKRLPLISPAAYSQLDARFPVAQAADAPAPQAPVATAGDVGAGRHAIDQYLCASCHRIPGVAGADATVGPTLAGVGARAYIGGMLPNTRDNMMRWLRDPQQVKPGTAMPNLHIRERDLADLAAFLETLDKQ
jgi:mono/diheme cytochrome c family protein